MSLAEIRRRHRVKTALAAAALLFGISVVHGPADGDVSPWSIPRTPADRSPGNAAQWWLFLDQSRQYLPEGASYTIRAGDRDAEMRLLMIAIGLLPDHEIRPTSYFGQPTGSPGGNDAAYVLAFGPTEPADGLELVALVEGGAVYQRSDGTR